MKVLSIGPDKELLRHGSVPHKRHIQYASQVEELHAIVFARRPYGRQKVEIAKNAWSYATGSRTSVGLLLDAYRIGRDLLKEGGTWVISTQDPFESGLIGYLLARKTGAHLLVQEHGDFFSRPYWRRESLLNRVRYLVGASLIKRADHLRVVSQRIARTLEARGVSPDRITVASVHTNVAHFKEAFPNSALEALRPADGVLMLTMARLVPQKNLPLLLRAFATAYGRGMRAHLVIVGAGSLQDRLQALAKRLCPEAVSFHEWTSDPAGALAAADIYALSSDYEGWARVCIEALASKTPIVMTDVGCAGEVVRDKVNGLVVPVRDTHALAEALYRLGTDPALRDLLAGAGMETIKAWPTEKESASLYIQSLTACLNAKQRHNKKD